MGDGGMSIWIINRRRMKMAKWVVWKFPCLPKSCSGLVVYLEATASETESRYFELLAKWIGQPGSCAWLIVSCYVISDEFEKCSAHAIPLIVPSVLAFLQCAFFKLLE